MRAQWQTQYLYANRLWSLCHFHACLPIKYTAHSTQYRFACVPWASFTSSISELKNDFSGNFFRNLCGGSYWQEKNNCFFLSHTLIETQTQTYNASKFYSIYFLMQESITIRIIIIVGKKKLYQITLYYTSWAAAATTTTTNAKAILQFSTQNFCQFSRKTK